MAFGNQYYNPYLQYQAANYGAMMPQMPQMQQPIQQPPQQIQASPAPSSPQSNADDRLWVSSESAAESYMLPASSFVRLWDSNQQCFYEKMTDANGKPYPVQVYDYKLRAAVPPAAAAPSPDWSEKITALEKRIADLEAAQKGADAE